MLKTVEQRAKDGKKGIQAAYPNRRLSILTPETVHVGVLARRVCHIERYGQHYQEKLVAKMKYAGRYDDCWLFIDQDMRADDNAEHFYRYVSSSCPNLKTYFLLHTSSPDWGRLEKDSFRLLAFGSTEHIDAAKGAARVISSHADAYVFSYLHGTERAPRRSQFTFLQHGVCCHDLSNWLNRIPIDNIIVSNQRERLALLNKPYRFVDEQVIMAGLPRHDSLRRIPYLERFVLIAPTWRRSIVGKIEGAGSRRTFDDRFVGSGYADAWRSLLHSTRLHKVLKKHCAIALFLPHPNIQPYLSYFSLRNERVRFAHNLSSSYQELLGKAELMITDYSSVAFDMAYLMKSVLYYQFDRSCAFDGKHTFSKGYFDYDVDGFGPVAEAEEDLIAQLDLYLSANTPSCQPYYGRMEQALAFRDRSNCRRVLHALLQPPNSSLLT